MANQGNRGRPRKNKVDTTESQVGQSGTVNVPAEGEARIEKPEVEVVDGPGAMKYAEEMAFMEEKMEIVVHESTDPNAADPVQVNVNGRNQFFFRGRPIVVKRKFVERLARAKRTSYNQNLNHSDPNKFNQLHSRTALQYPFSVVSDPNPKGADWLKKVLAEPA